MESTVGSAVPRWQWGEPVEVLARSLAAGGVLAVPTESSYGLAVDPRSAAGVETIYRIKGRERGKPLPVVAADVEQLVALGIERSSPLLRTASGLWPAPLSVLLPLVEPLAAAAGGATLAVRVPAHRRLRRLLKSLGFALTATSANRSGEPPILDPKALEPLLAGRPAVIVSSDVLPGGPPSTLVASDGDHVRILRHGAFPEDLLSTRRPVSTGVADAAGKSTTRA